ncbi:MAG TPA: cytochrome ubiquinol oxidase subunit I [Ignavibacteria bacterium]|nr:cytochrome ubiquinol oxidase subunit I [Ignavibacteria bacterium]HMR41909.1 cytochrome ubiquinol oxidase subunit I [Ignavibacteria bacterium]
MDEVVIFLSRLQFAFTNIFHYFYPPFSIGLGVFLVISEGIYLKTKNLLWLQITRFWIKVFALTFTIGVATGIPMEFQFGTNWANYSRYVGDVFGSALAAEGIFAFFLESGFLAILVFGSGKVSPKFHYFSTIMVCLGAHFSAVWIVIANAWMQTPAGFEIVMGPNGMRAEIIDFWAMVFNPSSMIRLMHVITGCWLAGAFFVLSVSSWYLLKRKHIDFARSSMKVALVIALFISLSQMFISGDMSAKIVHDHQPAKFAAMEGHWDDGPADMTILGYIDESKKKTVGLKIPGLTSFLIDFDPELPIKGINSIPEDERPPLQITFQSYHLMIFIGVILILLSLLGCYLWWRGKLFDSGKVLWIFVFSVFLPVAANTAGWITAEVGRQPWIVYGLMKTGQGVSPNLSSGQLYFSNVLFFILYLMLFIVFIYVLNNKIKHGPDSLDTLNAKSSLAELPKRIRDIIDSRKKIN